MKNILAIQSHVVYGHAGNSAAEFPMRRLGAKRLAAEHRSIF
ncbi:pyridoxamine kinase [Escherichia coli]|uniref:Pyridoxamine kinase n=1 Tax=Escherichia coli TaxID=562 RepID=A0A376NJE0_ECOLX|nr:pyridoxamine kinase [Escherichia coli]STM38884.1 pyridoxamine kinase [Escherichia coli]